MAEVIIKTIGKTGSCDYHSVGAWEEGIDERLKKPNDKDKKCQQL